MQNAPAKADTPKQAHAKRQAHFFWRERLHRPCQQQSTVPVSHIEPASLSKACAEQTYFKLWLSNNRSSVAVLQPAERVEKDKPSDTLTVNQADNPSLPEADALEVKQSPTDWVGRLKKGLSKTRGQLSGRLSGLLGGKPQINPELLEDIESELLSADIGIEATERLIASLTQKLERQQLSDSTAVLQALRQEMQAILEQPLCQSPVGSSENTVIKQGLNPLSANVATAALPASPFVLLVVGVNGAGKTTTIGKLANQQSQLGRKVLLAAGDTFRAAAVEQLKVWASRLQLPIIAQDTGADSASVLYDAFEAAKARNVDLLIADTAGRLHNKSHLMAELSKIKRVLSKLDPAAPHGVLLVLDAGNGQNALNQAREFHEALGVTGVALTKLDGTAKGGVSFAITETLNLPIWYIGLGEQVADLREFDAADFVDALLEKQ